MKTKEQNLSSQINVLNNAGCIRIFMDKISGKKFKCKGLTTCLNYLRTDDTLVIYHLDRIADLSSIKLVSFQDNLDISSAVDRFTMQILASLAENNRSLIC